MFTSHFYSSTSILFLKHMDKLIRIRLNPYPSFLFSDRLHTIFINSFISTRRIVNAVIYILPHYHLIIITILSVINQIVINQINSVVEK